MSEESLDSDLKLKTARTLKWNVVDRISTQVIYAVTGIILANLLPKSDFGMVSAILVFQAFASLMVDSGFSYALIQRKHPTRLDYSSVLWFNMAVACILYVILWFAAPLIAYCFENDQRIIPLSRVMFLTFILNASAIVQTNRLVKLMNVKMVAVSNSLGLAVGSVVGIWLALAGYGAWAIVWQSIALSASKSILLWLTSHWTPMWKMSLASLKSFFSVGSEMMLTSFLNTVFQNIYSFFIGHRDGLVSLAYYSQSDKWSKMGISSLSQILTSSFLPALSHLQDDRERFVRAVSKMNRFTSYLLFPAIALLMLLATPIFHALFNTKWDASIAIFQLLLFRGVFTVFMGLYNNYIIALGKARAIVRLEVVRDVLAIIALIVTLPYLSISDADDVVLGVKIMVCGQIIASILSWAVALWTVAKITGITVRDYLLDSLPYALLSTAFVILLIFIPVSFSPVTQIIVVTLIAMTIYVGLNILLDSKIQYDVWDYISYRFRKKCPVKGNKDDK